MIVVLAGLAALGVASALVLSAFRDNLVFFHSPSDLAAEPIPPERVFRLGGLVEEGSVKREGETTHFRVTDLAQSVAVSYSGLLPDLFREGQGVVAEGRLTADGEFIASKVLAKHDENYMPPEVADSLKRTGHWQPGGGE